MRNVLFAFAAVLLLAAPAVAQEINLSIVSPKEGSETFAGRTIELVVDINLSESTNRPLTVTSPGFACRYFSGADAYYRYTCVGKVPIKLEPKPFTVTATADWKTATGIVPRTATATLTLNVTNRLYPEIVYPAKIENDETADKGHIKAKLWYPQRDAQYDPGKSVAADINGEKVDFVWSASEGLFVANYDFGRFEPGKEFALSVLLLGDVAGSATLTSVFVSPEALEKPERFPGELVFGTIMALAVVIVVVVLCVKPAMEERRRRKRWLEEKTEEVRAVLERKMQLWKLIKAAEREYLRQKLSAGGYKSRLEEYQKELNDINTKLYGTDVLKAYDLELAKNYAKAEELYEKLGDAEDAERISEKVRKEQGKGAE